MAYLLNLLGGSIAVNLGSLLAALLCLYCFLEICRHFDLPHAGLLGMLLVVHPSFWINAASAMDYVWAAAFLMAGLWLGLRRRPLSAGLALGLAAAARLTAAIPAGGILLFLFCRKPRPSGLWTGALVCAAVTVSAYLLPADFKGWNLQFLGASTGAAELWTPWLRLGRFAYKNIYFWGLPAVLFLAGCLVPALRRVKEVAQESLHPLRPLAILCLGVILISELVFLRFPIEQDYLLPTLPFWLLLLGILFSKEKERAALWVLLALLLLGCFVNINLARPDRAGQASSAEFGLWLEEGPLVSDIRQRLLLRGCDSRDCYADVMQGLEE